MGGCQVHGCTFELMTCLSLWVMLHYLLLALLAPVNSYSGPRPRTRTTADGTIYAWDPETRIWKALGPRDPEPVLQIAGRHFPLEADALHVAGLRIAAPCAQPHDGRLPADQAHGDTGRTTWDGAVVLSKFLEHSRSSGVRGRHVVELGSGTGVAGLAAAALGARRVHLTDLAYRVAPLQRTAGETLALWGATEEVCRDVRVRELDWGDPQWPQDEPIDIILAADVVWLAELVPLLVRALDALTITRPEAVVLLAHQTRSREVDALFFRLLGPLFRWSEADPAEYHPSYRCEAIRVYTLERR